MTGAALLGRVRRAAGLSQTELARRAGTSRPTLSAYENGRKSPTLDTASRLLDEAGYDLDAAARVHFAEVAGARGEQLCSSGSTAPAAGAQRDGDGGATSDVELVAARAARSSWRTAPSGPDCTRSCCAKAARPTC